MKTELCDLLGIKYPIIQGGMAWVADCYLASAVSKAGGLGLIATGQMPPETLKEEIRRARELTGNNVGVNILLLHTRLDEIMQVVIDEKVPVITTGAGNPGKYMEALKEAGTKVIPVVPSVALAQRMEKLGADAIVCEGTEAGGHIGEITTMAMTPQIVDAVSVPVIAAGGIADGRGMAAALALGAKGVQIGTRFMCSTECTIDPKIKEMVLKASDRDTVVTGRSTGHPVRVLKNQLSRLIEKLDKENKAEEIEEKGTGALQRAMREGDISWGSVMSGQIAGLVKEIIPCKQIIEEIMADAENTIESLNNSSLVVK